MKMKLFILLASCTLVTANTYSQAEITDADSAKRTYYYFVKIETMTGEKIDAALSRFSVDSVFVILIDKKYIPLANTSLKIIRNEEESGMAADNIRSIYIKKDRNIIYADSLKKRKGKAITRNLAFLVIGEAFSGVAGSFIPVTASTTLATADFVSETILVLGGAVALGALVVSQTGQKFKLNGDKENYNEMLLGLTIVKNIPVENDTEKQ